MTIYEEWMEVNVLDRYDMYILLGMLGLGLFSGTIWQQPTDVNDVCAKCSNPKVNMGKTVAPPCQNGNM